MINKIGKSKQSGQRLSLPKSNFHVAVTGNTAKSAMGERKTGDQKF
jgi:hypothetical protein